eukprot:CAMPEP_0194388630 /NCGR_PEP_ID=MMETSP0174-20130528/99600_1 /TAXON_ID=216777 /ORGANISM="Proboscia alata, Strain PI-D3" /LENGTH=1144 /DNA_ID=CAMNT_0039180103 /DNA_START=303 /DNA_END=3734 /DNA_ORIENTATION=-
MSISLSSEDMNNLSCRDTLLQLVCRGTVIIGQLKIFSNKVPPIFLFAEQAAMSDCRDVERTSKQHLWGWFGDSANSEVIKENGVTKDDMKFIPLLFDFSYLVSPEKHEQSRLDDNSGSISALDGEFSAMYKSILSNFYLLFENIYMHQYYLNSFITSLKEGFFIHSAVESILLEKGENGNGVLFCECIHLYGVMLLLLEDFFPGKTRERLLIAYLRHATFREKESNREKSLSNFEGICKLCRCVNATQISTTGKQSSEKHENETQLFARFPLPSDVIKSVIGAILSDDLYNRSTAFPNFDHRSTRLANQASMLYVILYFEPLTLSEEMGTMRQVVDKFFSDNWIISMYMGMVVDLSVEWASYEAAKTALENVVQLVHVKQLNSSNWNLIAECMIELRCHLATGTLTDLYVLDNSFKLLNCIRRCNVAIRWRLMHRCTTNDSFLRIIRPPSDKVLSPSAPPDATKAGEQKSTIITIILFSSQLEMKLKEVYGNLLATKAYKWKEYKSDAMGKMAELSDYYTGKQALTKVIRNEGLVSWFKDMGDEIGSLSYKEVYAAVTGRKIQHCIKALEDVEQFEVIDCNFHVKSFLCEVRDLLMQMVRIVGVKDEIVHTLKAMTDMSYGWEICKEYSNAIHARVQANPTTVTLLRGFFFKLETILDAPYRRMGLSCNFSKISLVKEYYQSNLLSVVTNILDIIPTSIFHILSQITAINSEMMRKLPSEIDVDSIKEFSQPDGRFELAKLTYRVSIFAEGLLDLDNVKIGDISLNPRHLLCDGLKGELYCLISEVLSQAVNFPLSQDVSDDVLVSIRKDVIKHFTALAKRVDRMQVALEYIQDFIGILGLKMWSDALSRIIHQSLNHEVKKYGERIEWSTKLKQDHDTSFSTDQATTNSVTFLGKIVNILLRLTDPQITIHSRECMGWFLDDGTEMCGKAMFSLLLKSIGVFGLSSLQHLISFRILFELKRFSKYYSGTVNQSAVLLEYIRDGLFPEWKTPEGAASFYARAVSNTERFALPVMTCLRRLGQLQLLRKMIREELWHSSQLESNISSVLLTFDKALLDGIKSAFHTSSHGSIPKENKPIIRDISQILSSNGVGDPLSTIFILSGPLEGLPELLLVFVVSNLSKLSFDTDFGSLVRLNKKFPIDGW